MQLALKVDLDELRKLREGNKKPDSNTFAPGVAAFAQKRLRDPLLRKAAISLCIAGYSNRVKDVLGRTQCSVMLVHCEIFRV